MAATLAFDVYGTLINTHGVVVALEKHLGEKAIQFSHVWREKQLEYSFRRGLMQNYETFAVCTRHALDYTCSFFNTSLTEQNKLKLLDVYKVLPPFDDVREGLTRAKDSGCNMFAFSNGSAEAVEMLLVNAEIRDFFDGVVSVDDLKSFKPNPGVYCHFLRKAGSTGAESWLISGNPFDVIGAISAGMKGAWVQRSPEAIFDPWGIEPTITVQNLSELAATIQKYSH
jgi:2-haloacid dehalogenase